MGTGSGDVLLNLLVAGAVVVVLLVLGVFVKVAVQQWFEGGSSTHADTTDVDDSHQD